MRSAVRVSMRRALAMLGAGTVGALITLGMGEPAFACHPVISAKVDCADAGKVIITWTITNSEAHRAATLVRTAPRIHGVDDGAALAGSADGGVLTGTTTAAFSPGGSASIAVTLHWPERGHSPEHTETRPGTADFGRLRCGGTGGGTGGQPGGEPAHETATATFDPHCDGTVDVLLTNPLSTAITVTATGTGGMTRNIGVPAKSTAPAFTVPAVNAAQITLVRVRQHGKTEPVASFSWRPPARCGAPDVTATAGCDAKSLVITNPAGNVAITATVTAGAMTKQVQAPAGTTQTVKLPLDTLTADVQIGDIATSVRFDRATTCAAAGPLLPVTGTNATLIAGGALVLIGLGGGLLHTARRRRLYFTA